MDFLAPKAKGWLRGSCLQESEDRAWMCALLYPHMRPLLVWSGVKDGKRREMAGSNFILHDQVPTQNAMESKNPKLELGLPSCYEGIFAKVVRYFI